MPLIIVPSVCEESNNPFGESSTCFSNAQAYASLSMAVSTYHLQQSFLHQIHLMFYGFGFECCIILSPTDRSHLYMVICVWHYAFIRKQLQRSWVNHQHQLFTKKFLLGIRFGNLPRTFTTLKGLGCCFR